MLNEGYNIHQIAAKFNTTFNTLKTYFSDVLIKKPSTFKRETFEEYIKRGGCVTRTLKNMILRENLREYKCNICGNPGIWNGKKLTLELHHLDGNHLNTNLSNLVFICPNCHSQTENYKFTNKKHKMED